MASVDAIRSLRRAQIAADREAALAGEPFAIMNSDEGEEIFTVFGIGVQVINSWNLIIIRDRKAAHFTEVLHRHGYAGAHFFGLGFAASLEPQEAPWGGLPKPTIIVGSTRDESELRVTELWARRFGCALHPLDFNFASPAKTLWPIGWWNRLRDDWESLVDADRLDLRVSQMHGLIEHVERLTGRSFSIGALERLLARVNEQMDLWSEANDLMVAAEFCPVSFRDQLAAYQMMWSRGSDASMRAIEDYAREIAQRVRDGVRAYAGEPRRVFYACMDPEPDYHPFMQSELSAALIGRTTPDLYAREPHGDVLRSLSAKNLFLFAINDPNWWVHQARSVRADVVIAIERNAQHPSSLARTMAAAGIPFLSMPSTQDTSENRMRLTSFFQQLD